MGDPDRFIAALALRSLCLVAAGHKDRIVYSGSELDRSDDDRRDERKLCSRKSRNTEIDEDGKFNDQHQQERQTDRTEYKENDDKILYP